MRFFKEGPSIPDDLLFARDEGRVVFFGGAGVSRARAGLPDFFGLADQVIKKLHVPSNHPASAILMEAREIEARRGVSGLISADRVFGLLERDFTVHDIQEAVASSLRPAEGVDLSAHRILVDLATTPEGKVRLVTTNFERLFEACRENLRIWRRPLLPDPFRPREMDGIIHLHGCATIDYSGADGDGFVLSTADFGRAYLSEAWATEFFRKILAHYVVVFVGYTADDPPVQYLLEALNSSGNKLPVYAFQAGFANEVAGKWLHKGVEAIQYDETNKHLALWSTLAAWADRAKAPDEWFQSVIESAKRGPAMLEPYERGQVAHVVSKVEGVRKFSECDPPPPAEWLCVFDPFRRYAKPGDAGRFGEEGEFVDPFVLYGLDSDVVPSRVSAQEQYSRPDRSVPSNAWDGLTANRLDRENLRDANFSAIRGHWATHFPRLSPRLGTLAVWIGRVADQPTTVWWAANQHGLHPDIQEQIRWELKRTQKNVSPIIRKCWQYLFEAWGENQRDFDRDWYDLKQTTDKEGWNSAAIRKYAEISRPYLKVESRYWGGPIPQVMTPETRIDDMMRLEVL